MSERQFDSAQLRAMTEFKVQLHDDRYEFEPIVAGGDFFYDPQVLWDWDSYKGPWAGPEDSIIISDVGGQGQPETDWRMGYGGIFRLLRDNTIETILPHGQGRQACILRPTIAPAGWGDFGGHIFFASQIVPHRRGAVVEHMIYRYGPGDDKPDAFCIPPRAGALNSGLTGALVPGVFGRPGTAEEGLFLFFSMHNCTIYAARPDGSVEPYIIMDGKSGPGPIMPYRLFYADATLAGEPNVLLVSGKWNAHFNEQSTQFEPGHFRVVGQSVDPTDLTVFKGGPGHRAPSGFGPLAGEYFRPENNGFISSVHWTENSYQALPYNAEIYWRDGAGKEHLFASGIQAGQNLIGFAGDRMIVSNMGHSYSSGNFKYPDGTVFAIRYKG